MADAYYVGAYEDFLSMGLRGAAEQVLLEGLAATNNSERLVEQGSPESTVSSSFTCSAVSAVCRGRSG